ncbi:MAG: DUF1080 domain-containing protein, partial [Planctomycetota bacterium]|nr:DUF1080 domain-containing protein [Planctomycetota bacterium]
AWAVLLATAISLAASASAAPADGPPDPFLGDWQGQYTRDGKRPSRPLVAQVIPRGGGRYAIVFHEVFDHRCPVYGRAEGRAEGGRLALRGDGFTGEAADDRMTGTGRRLDPRGVEEGRPFALERVVRASPRLGAKPPDGAVVLFDGSGFDHWEPDRGEAITWKIADGVAHVWPTLSEHAIATGLRTKRAFGDYHLHVEFRLPLLAEATGQTRANGGISFEDFRWHELQILDSYGLPGYWDECGSIYRIAAPKVNMCAPPGQWQSYDVTYHRPRYAEDGKLLRPARVTVDHNGTVVQNDLALPGGNVPKNRLGSRKIGRIRLQNHGDPLAFRNIWVVEVEGDGSR